MRFAWNIVELQFPSHLIVEEHTIRETKKSAVDVA
jgi:hypothetical protein